MRIDIFCESGSMYGLGHFYRCLKLALLCAKLPQIHTIILHNRGDFSPNLRTLLAQESIESVIKLHYDGQDWNNGERIQDLINNYASRQQKHHKQGQDHHKNHTLAICPFDIVIIDSYEADSHIYTALAQNAQALICLDDTQRTIYPPRSIILSSLPESYEFFSQERFAACDYTLWCGEEYVILPTSSPMPWRLVDSSKQKTINTPESALESSSPNSKNHLDSSANLALNPQCQAQKPPESTPNQIPESQTQLASGICQVFVSFGGVDRENYTQGFVDSLAQFMRDNSAKPTCYNSPESSINSRDSSKLDSGWHFHIVLGGGYPHELDTNALPAGSFSLYRNLSPAEFLALACLCDCAISAGGGSMLELLALQVPSIIFKSAKNQHAQIIHWAVQGAIIHAKSLESIPTHLCMLLAPERLSAMRTLLGSLALGTTLPLALNNLAQSLRNSTNPSQK
ncbi:hypothetical protein [uncultured Helicobacter sp.]|uniref:hypothetical protein n=1 Tax=uncultured Helicobacter sp. TaxID=175537 RepID=UPI002621552A|nr:hypothetical protein [uncultured Helicobacter sp.]